MKLFGSQSWSSIIHKALKIPLYVGLLFSFIVGLVFIMASLDYFGINNPIGGLDVHEESFDLYPKLFFDEAISIPIGGFFGFMQYVVMTMSGILLYTFLARFLGQFFFSLSQKSVFVKQLTDSTRSLAWLLIVIAMIQLTLSFFYDLSNMSTMTSDFILLLIGMMLWFLSKVFEVGHDIQEELRLTI